MQSHINWNSQVHNIIYCIYFIFSYHICHRFIQVSHQKQMQRLIAIPVTNKMTQSCDTTQQIIECNKEQFDSKLISWKQWLANTVLLATTKTDLTVKLFCSNKYTILCKCKPTLQNK